MEDNRTQIKFSNPDIEGTPQPQLISLEQETPIEGTSERDNGESFIWHKWLVQGDQYFMASDSLDGMLKLIPSKVGKVLKIEKVENPKGGEHYPFFQINGMNKDQIITEVGVDNVQTRVPTTVPQPVLQTQIDTTEDAIIRLDQKLDKVISVLDEMSKKEALPF